MLALLGHRRVAPGVAPALGGVDPEHRARLVVQPLGQALGGLHAEAVHEQLLGEFAFGLQARHQLGHLAADRDRLHRDHVELRRRAAVDSRAEEVGEADPLAGGLARADEARQLALAVLGVEHDDLVPYRVAGEEAEQRAGVQVVLLAPHALEARAEVVARAVLPRLAFDAAPAPVQLEQHVRVEVAVDLVEVDGISRTPQNGGSGTGTSVRAAERTESSAKSTLDVLVALLAEGARALAQLCEQLLARVRARSAGPSRRAPRRRPCSRRRPARTRPRTRGPPGRARGSRSRG